MPPSASILAHSRCAIHVERRLVEVEMMALKYQWRRRGTGRRVQDTFPVLHSFTTKAVLAPGYWRKRTAHSQEHGRA